MGCCAGQRKAEEETTSYYRQSYNKFNIMTAKKKKNKQGSFLHWICSHCCLKDDSCYLYAFDFDHTILNENSDTAITDVVPNPVPDHVRNIFDGTNWTEFMDHIFRYIASQGATIDIIKHKIRQLELTPGMEHLLHRVCEAIHRRTRSHFIIISDANDFFIKTRLFSMRPPVVPTEILSNHATYSQDKEYLKIYPYDDQRECPNCPRNMCKGKALKNYVIQNGPFTKIYYSGDGSNDACPAQYLSENDVLFVRQGFSLAKIIEKGTFKGIRVRIVAKIVYFENASTIEEAMMF